MILPLWLMAVPVVPAEQMVPNVIETLPSHGPE